MTEVCGWDCSSCIRWSMQLSEAEVAEKDFFDWIQRIMEMQDAANNWATWWQIARWEY